MEILCESGVVEKMCDKARVVVMFGASRVLGLEGRAVCGRGCDGAVFTADAGADEEGLLSSDERYKCVEVVADGESIYA